jgi:hypothetical protein
MKRFIKYFTALLLLTIGWAFIVFNGLLNGWWHNPISKSKDTATFVTAVKERTQKEFAGNFAMAIMKDGKVESELFSRLTTNQWTGTRYFRFLLYQSSLLQQE